MKGIRRRKVIGFIIALSIMSTGLLPRGIFMQERIGGMESVKAAQIPDTEQTAEQVSGEAVDVQEGDQKEPDPNPNLELQVPEKPQETSAGALDIDQDQEHRVTEGLSDAEKALNGARKEIAAEVSESAVKQKVGVPGEADNPPIVNITFPTELNIAVNINGGLLMGQILSQDYDFINYSNVPVEIQIKDLYYEFSNPDCARAMAEPVDPASDSHTNDIYLYWGRADIMDVPFTEERILRKYDEYTKETVSDLWGRQEIAGQLKAGEQDIVITDQHLSEPVTIELAAAKYDENGQLLALSGDNRASYRFFGSMNKMPALDWIQQKVSIHAVYSWNVKGDAD